MKPEPRIIRFVHATPGRTRLRLGWLREFPDEAEPLADQLATLDETIEVQIRPSTGSVLCCYDPERLDADAIVAAVRRHSGVAIVLEPGETQTGVGFLAVGAAEILGSRALPAPPWFNLAWWAYRTFTTTGGEPEEGVEGLAGAEPPEAE